VARPGDLLRRFRLMAVPGAAGIAGVPVDREAVLREELEPVFAALRGADHAADEVVARAKAEADDRLARAGVRAREILVQSRESMPAARAAAGVAETSSAEIEAAAIRAGGHDEAGRIRRDAGQRSSVVVDELVRRVMSVESSSRGVP